MPNPVKVPYQKPELRVYGTLRELTLTGSGNALDCTPNNNSNPQHSSVCG